MCLTSREHNSLSDSVDEQTSSKPDSVWSIGVCASCGNHYILGEMFCENCGAQILPLTSMPSSHLALKINEPAISSEESDSQSIDNDLTCSFCGKLNIKGSSFCLECGTKLTSADIRSEIAEVSSKVGDAKHLANQKKTVRFEHETLHLQSSNASLIIQGSAERIELESDKTEFLLGRTDALRDVFPDIDFVPYGGDKFGVSRRHAKLTFQGAKWFIQDLNSTNFTFVNNERLLTDKTYQLNSGDEIRLGMLVMEFRANKSDSM